MTQQRKRVAIVGAGSAGMSAAYALSLSPDKFDVVLYERSANCGGMATSTDIDAARHGASYINDGVQGASPVFYNTFKVFEELGFGSSEVGMQISFGKDKDEFWSNVFPTPVIDKYQSDIKRFGKVLNIIKTFEPVFAMMSVETMLKLFRFSNDFGEVIVYPLVALFFVSASKLAILSTMIDIATQGTGNQTPFVSAAILERVFKDPSMRLFEYSPDSFLASIPEMRAFPRLSLLYETWQSVIESTGNVKIALKHEVTSVKRRKNVTIKVRETEGTNNDQQVVNAKEEREEVFDEIVFAGDASATLKILGDDASWLERKVLGNVLYLWDISVTHSDLDYMKKVGLRFADSEGSCRLAWAQYYNVEYDKSFESDKRKDDKEAQEQYEFASKHFRPLYFIRSYPEDKKKIEMSFDLTVYQAQFQGESEYGPAGTGKPRKSATLTSARNSADLPSKPTDDVTAKQADRVRETSKSDPEHRPEPPLEQHVFQTIFLNKDTSEHQWSRDDIAKDKIILEKWWHQQSHRCQLYRWTVPFMMFLNGKHHTHFAGAWTILNMHEIGIVSGFAAAYKLGAKYPFNHDEDCKRLFALYLGASHGSRMRGEDRKGFFM
ncbi:hypothetical protein OIV83_006398 [Microbotryomycetes sp. JL201]|nr:hypothetical protein OIV83_006398 [Microbotryomycetes sp. JL201]